MKIWPCFAAARAPAIDDMRARAQHRAGSVNAVIRGKSTQTCFSNNSLSTLTADSARQLGLCRPTVWITTTFIISGGQRLD